MLRLERLRSDEELLLRNLLTIASIQLGVATDWHLREAL